MEGLLILIAIYVLDYVIKKKAAKKKEALSKRQESVDNIPDDDTDDVQEEASQHPPRSLQDLIRQFENAQREAAQGNIEPPTPPVDDEEDIELPVVKPANPGHFSFTEIAESVIQWEEVCIDYLQEAFGFSEATATKVLSELQKHKIVGHDMGDGFCDVLVHDQVELSNLFKREQAEAQKSMEEELARKKAELSRQRELNELETRARKAREDAETIESNIDSDSISGETDTSPMNKPHIHLSHNIEDIRRGFIWAKVIDEPRFKKRWTAQSR